MPSPNAIPTFTLEELKEHPLSVYVEQSVSARDKVVDEIGELKLKMNSGASSPAQQAQARIDRADLISALGLMDEADRAFLARIVVAPFPPKAQVVQRTIQLNQKLAAVIASANKARVYIQLVTKWANALTAVVTGQVPSMPAAAAPAPAPTPQAPASPPPTP